MSNCARQIAISVTPEEKELLEQAASLKGVSLNQYMLVRALGAAREEIEKVDRIVLSDRDRDLFVEVMENPPELKGKFKEAIRDYQQKYNK